MANKNTETMQNIVSRLAEELVLEAEKPTKAMKAQLAKVRKTFIELTHQLDVLNDMKGEL